MRSHLYTSVLMASLFSAAGVRADEGMWPFNLVPRDKAHGGPLTDAWLDKVRLASVRVGRASGSFVGPNGLVLTNHHVGSDCIQKLSAAGKDYMANGYLAGKDGPEVKCPDLELNVALSIEDVTDKVRAARKPGMSDADANTAMKGEMSRIEKECGAKTGNKCDVVTLYAGGRYDLYTYKKYTDVRLVFAPEFAIAFFGGDADNFVYPRFDLDMAVFRVYEDGRPIKPKEHLRWNASLPKEGEAAFVSGHPYATSRMNTVAQNEVARDVTYPYVIDEYQRARTALLEFAKEGKEAEREIGHDRFALENGLKAYGGMLKGLKDPALMKKKADDEAALKKAIMADPKLKAEYGDAFDKVAKAQKDYARIYRRYAALESRTSLSRVLDNARDLVRLADERELPNEKRLREYADANLESLKLAVLSPAPRYGGVELALAKEWLERLVRDLGPNDPALQKALAGRTPERAAREALALTQMTDANARKTLYDGGKRAVDASQDPAIVLMRALDGEARQARKEYEDLVEAPMRLLGEKIAQATFAVRGASTPPDATGTLRLSIGVVKGYTEDGKAIPANTDFAGLYAHATGKDPLKLPQRWIDAKPRLNMTTAFDFVSTDDIIGGNSGSPVVNAAGEIVGLIFDGNLSSLPNRFVYGETTQRAVSVSTAAMAEALRKVYGADALAQELEAP
jgi:S1-C subfamily serine protease